MKKNALVFSVVREQSVFMTVVISVLTFLSVLALGIALSIGTGVSRWNNQWEKYATVQIVNSENATAVKKIFEENANKIESVNEISKSEMERMMKSWVSSGAKISNYLPQMVLQIPDTLKENYNELLHNDQYPPCYKVIPDLTRLQVHSWLAALQTERLEQKTEAIFKRVEQCNGSWEDGYFVTLARNYGFGINGDAFEMWAKNVPLHAVDKHRDDLFQIEAIFMGQAGLLQLESIPERYQIAALNEGYFTKLRNEYLYLAHKFSLTPMDFAPWHFLRLRPQNFPYIRIAQLANLYYERKAGLSALLECETIEQLRQLLQTHVTPYWETHYMFGAEGPRSTKKTSITSSNLMIINTAIPMLFAVGRHRQREDLCDRAFDLLEQLKAEENHIIRMWKECGLEVQTAGDSQALIQLKKEYCDRRDCLRCRIGYEYLIRK